MKDSILNGAICCIGENKPKYYMKLRNLFFSIDKFGGSISKLDRVVFFMGIPKDEYKRELEQLGVKIINSTPVHEKFRHNNKVRMLEQDLGYDWYVLLDHDTIVCHDFSNFLDDMTLKVSPVCNRGPTLEFWKKIYEIFNLEIPSIRYKAVLDRRKILPYFNSGVLLVPGCHRKTLYDAWIFYVHELISIKDQLLGFTFFIDQIALALALQKADIKVTQLPVEMNFPITIRANATCFPKELNPCIIHYHKHINKKGCLDSKVSQHPSAKKKIKEFNELLRQYMIDSQGTSDSKNSGDELYKKQPKLESRIKPRGENLIDENTPLITENTKKRLVKPTFIVGCMRSGTTLLASLLGKHPDIVYCPFELRYIWSKVGGVSMASPKTGDQNCPNLTSLDVQMGQSERLTEAFYTEFKRNLGNKSPAAIFLSKNPHLCNKIHFVDALFPDARFIWIYRDLVKVVASLKKLFIRAYNKRKTWHYWPVKKDDETVRCWECYFGDSLPENIDKSRCFPGGDIKYLAEYWYENNKAIREFSTTISANRFLAIREEELVINPKLTLSKCDTFLGIPLKIPSTIDKINPNRNETWMNVFNEDELQTLLDFIKVYEKNIDCVFMESKSIIFYRKKLSEFLKLKQKL